MLPYILNITEKNDKMESLIKLWKNRKITFEEKTLIIKTFCLSQLIYVLQVYGIREVCVKRIDRIIFGNIWLSSRSEKERGIDEISKHNTVS